jgi:hypothetical protein
VTCAVCGCTYVPGIPSDRAEHRRRHDVFLHGDPAKLLASEDVVWSDGDRRITLVTDRSPLGLRKRAEAIATQAHREMGYDFAAYRAIDPADARAVHLFLFHCQARLVGFALLERLPFSWAGTWAELDAVADDGRPAPDPLPGAPMVWTVGFIWMHPSLRHSGHARQLLAVACARLGITPSTLGWYVPFEPAGERLARAFSPDRVTIA